MPSKIVPAVRGRKKRIEVDLGTLASALLHDIKEPPFPAPSISEQLALAAQQAASGEDMVTLDTFLLISKSVQWISKYSPQKTESTISLTEPQDIPLSVRTDILNLTQLVGSIRYNDHYWTYGTDMTDATLYKVSKDNQLVEWLSNWSTNSGKENILYNTASKITFHATSAGMECSGINFTDPELTIITRAPQKHPFNNVPTVLLGYFLENKKRPSKPGIIAINDHEDAGRINPYNYAHIPFHETIHSQQKDLGVMHAKGWNRKLGDFYPSGELWHFLAAAQAIIPPSIMQAYRAQFHEVAAHTLHQRFEDGLRKIVGDTAPTALNL